MKNTNKIRWGILSTAKIAREQMIPAIHASNTSEVAACASRNQEQADSFAKLTNIPVAYASYQALLEDDSIDVIYNPLPNHLHVPWTLKAIAAGKHVLCEKPIGLDVAEVETLIKAASAQPDLKVMEAFMYRFHPQWQSAKQQIADGRIGKINSIDAVFTYHNVDANNVRNQAGIGGGGLMDIGCYCISVARYLLDKEPTSVIAKLTFDEKFQTDKHANAILDFGDVRTSFYCSTQSEPKQSVYVSGEKGSLTIEIPFNPPKNEETKLIWQAGKVSNTQVIDACDHYVEQVDILARTITQQEVTPTPLSDALANMKVIDAIFASHQSQTWVNIK